MIAVVVGYLIYTLIGKMNAAAYRIGGAHPVEYYLLAMGLLLFWVLAAVLIWACAIDEDEQRRRELQP